MNMRCGRTFWQRRSSWICPRPRPPRCWSCLHPWKPSMGSGRIGRAPTWTPYWTASRTGPTPPSRPSGSCRCTAIPEAMPMSTGSWSSTGPPAKPILPAQRPLMRPSRSTTGTTAWAGRPSPRWWSSSAMTGRSTSSPTRCATRSMTDGFPVTTKRGPGPFPSLRTRTPGGMTETWSS